MSITTKTNCVWSSKICSFDIALWCNCCHKIRRMLLISDRLYTLAGGRPGSSSKCKTNLLYIYIEFYNFIVKYFCLIRIAWTSKIFWLRHWLYTSVYIYGRIILALFYCCWFCCVACEAYALGITGSIQTLSTIRHMAVAYSLHYCVGMLQLWTSFNLQYKYYTAVSDNLYHRK
jgi:hypothetical protein